MWVLIYTIIRVHPFTHGMVHLFLLQTHSLPFVWPLLFSARSTHIFIFSQLEDCFNCNNEAYFAYKQMHNEAKGMLTPVLARSTLLLNAMARCKWSLHKQTAYVTREPEETVEFHLDRDARNEHFFDTFQYFWHECVEFRIHRINLWSWKAFFMPTI